ncbi:MAG: hypothetical protein HY781_07795 [Chloroflexi bacterium]|nr:hypothetical protein [Chloroflexota bacterium]
MKIKILQESASLYPQPDPNSGPARTLNRGDVAELGSVKKGSGKQWVEITLLDGTKGFIPGETRIFSLLQAALNRKTPLYATADKSMVKMELPKRTMVNFLDLVEQSGQQWIYIQDASGNQGYIEGTTSITRRDPVTKKTGINNMLVGGGFFIVGLIVTLASYSSASAGGTYYLCWGAIIFGAIQFIQGLIQYLTAK